MFKKFLLLCTFSFPIFADSLVGSPAPLFELRTESNKVFRLADRKGKGWTVLFFYPKAGTPGCTKQACAFRDAIKGIQERNAEVYGISADSVEAQAKFHAEHKLSFTLLADPNLEAIKKYDVKMALVPVAKRWTFILDPQLVVRWVDQKVDPVMDPKHVEQALDELKKQQK